MVWWRRRAPEAQATQLGRLQERASAYLDGEITLAERTAFEAELAANEVTRELLDDLRMVRTALAGIGTVRAPRSFALLAPPAPVRVGPRRLEWATRMGTAVAALLFVVALTNGPQTGDTPVTISIAREVAPQAPVQDKATALATRVTSGPASNFVTPTPSAASSQSSQSSQTPSTTAAAAVSPTPPPASAPVSPPTSPATSPVTSPATSPALSPATPPLPSSGTSSGGSIVPQAAPAAPAPAGSTVTAQPTAPRALAGPGAPAFPATSTPPAPSIAGATPTVVATFTAPGERGSEAFRPEPTAAAAAFATRTPDPVVQLPTVTAEPTPQPTPVPSTRVAEPVSARDAGTTATPSASQRVGAAAIGLGALTLLFATASLIQFATRRAGQSR